MRGRDGKPLKSYRENKLDRDHELIGTLKKGGNRRLGTERIKDSTEGETNEEEFRRTKCL